MRSGFFATAAAAAVSVCVLQPQTAGAQEIKVGVIYPLSGPTAELGQQGLRGVETYIRLNAAAMKPYTFKLFRRDAKNPGGADAKVAVQELLTQEKVDIIIGWIYSPNAIASAPLIHAARKPGIIANAGTAFITNLTPYYARVSFSMWHAGYAMGEAAVKQLKAKTAVVGYTDFPPGKDSLDAFKKGFETYGGKVIDAIPMGSAAQVPDMTPFFQRAKEKKPEVFFVFVPAGPHAAAVVNTYNALGMRQAGIKLIGPGDIAPDNRLQSLGDAAVGLITMHHYNADLPHPANKAFVADWRKTYGADAMPDFTSVGGYDAMAGVVHAAHATKGKMDTAGVMNALKGWTYKDSPRGTFTIDPATRDVVQTEYLSEIVKDGNRLVLKPIGQIDNVKDQCKELKIGPCAKIPK